jgi:hypothetical protein
MSHPVANILATAQQTASGPGSARIEHPRRRISFGWLAILPSLVVRGGIVFGIFVSASLAPACLGAEFDPNSPRQTISLNGEWFFQRDQGADWKKVRVPSSFQEHEGTEFHGVGWYRKAIEPPVVPAGRRVLLHFQAAATEAEVWWNGERLGTHLGGWTPFRFDITELVRRAPPGRAHELRVRLDEKVGHNTQGFLPVIAPHFGGLWQDVALLVVPETYADDLQMLAVGEPGSGELRLEIPLAGQSATSLTNVTLRCRLRGQETWVDLSPSSHRSGQTLFVRAPVAGARPWSPAEPNLYEVEVALPGAEADRVRTRAAFRSIEAFGQQFRLNGRPLNIRGLLDWGYAAPRVAPAAGEAMWRSELEFARAHGFNLMKFCLWIPPQRYLELADEMGVLAWMEYPTWHPNFTAKFLAPLRREFREFFLYDRNHPCVVLRSLTCETGPSAQLSVLQSLYDSAHELIPGALVEDDSSWIGWNRVHDFYDDHPYGNNHTWIKTLEGFNDYILAHGLKPLVLGEATAADTWLDREALLARLGEERPWWAPGVLDDSARWMEQMRRLAGSGGLAQLRPDSLRYGLLMRKYQIEAFRREVPYGGHVISVIRDVPNAPMGLLDHVGRSKWTDAEWSWQRDTLCLLKTGEDARSFCSGKPLRGEILLSHFGPEAIADGRLSVTLEAPGQTAPPLQRREVNSLQQNPGTLARLLALDWPAPDVATPTHLVIRAELKTAQGDFRNEWPVWIVPANSPESLNAVQVHASLAAALRRELFPGCPTFDFSTNSTRVDPGRNGLVVVASRFDDELVRFLEAGGRVLLLPDGRPHSLPLGAHWFLRGAPYIPDHSLSRQIPRDLFVELQHFDLAADIVPNLSCLEAFDPILMLWDTHDLKTVKTHGVIFETRAAQGRLLVSAARHDGTHNAAGRWLLGVLLNHLRSAEAPHHALPDETWAYLKSKLHAEQTNLVNRAWEFRPDPQNEGLTRGWHNPKLASDEGWKDIRIGAYWESQGYPALDGWAWYRLWVDIPQSWQGRDIFLSFAGVDDVYELYVNGELAGKGGDLATHQDALSEKKSHNLSGLVQPGQKALIAVRVHDWYGAGGIFRPVTLGTIPFNPSLDLLVE